MTTRCFAALLVFPFPDHAKSLRSDPCLVALEFWTSAVTTVRVSATFYMITLSAAASETLNHTPEISLRLHILQFVLVQ